jgi:protein-S-isoprenylcysteine O-methyltransferase Ste14
MILVGLPILCQFLFPVMTVIPRPYTYFGVIPMLLGLGLNVWAAREFRKARTGFQLRGGGADLVTSGPFRFSRNPMYLGMLLWLLGLAVLLGSLIAFVFPALLFLLANFYAVPLEERAMAETFGERYAAYRRRVRRWL